MQIRERGLMEVLIASRIVAVFSLANIHQSYSYLLLHGHDAAYLADRKEARFPSIRKVVAHF
jgi:hypothetical protein